MLLYDTKSNIKYTYEIDAFVPSIVARSSPICLNWSGSRKVVLNCMVSQITLEAVTIDEAELIQICRRLSISDRITALRHFRELRGQTEP